MYLFQYLGDHPCSR